MTREEMIDRIHDTCTQNGFVIQYWHDAGGGWKLSKEQFKNNMTETSDINIFGIYSSGTRVRWGSRYSINTWAIPVRVLSDPEFQSEFEQEFYSLLFYKLFQ